MIEALIQLSGLLGPTALHGAAVFLRIGAVMALLPAFGERSVPMRVRAALAAMFTVIVAPAVAPSLPALDASDLIGAFLATEVVIGLGLGVVLRLFVIALQLAGAMAAQTISIAQIFGGQNTADPQPAIGHVLVVAGLALAVLLGLHIKVGQFLIFSYQLLPAGSFPDASDLMEWGVQRTAQAFALGFALAMPFVITSLIYNLTLGVINRAMPQLMVAFVGAPAITWGGLAILAICSPLMLQVWITAMDAFLIDPTGAVR